MVSNDGRYEGTVRARSWLDIAKPLILTRTEQISHTSRIRQDPSTRRIALTAFYYTSAHLAAVNHDKPCLNVVSQADYHPRMALSGNVDLAFPLNSNGLSTACLSAVSDI